MRNLRFALLALPLTCAVAGIVQAQQPPAPPKASPPVPLPMQEAPPGPYKAVAITMPPAVNDASFEAFRNELAEIAKRKDRGALAGKVVAKGFFWQREDSNDAEGSKSSIDNLAEAVGLDRKDGLGWQALASYAAETSASPLPETKGVICAPAIPVFNEQEMEQVASKTRTDVTEWGYPTANGLEVRAKPEAGAPVIDKLGMVMVRTLPEDGPAPSNPDWIKVVTPAGKVGYTSAMGLAPFGSDQLCYAKDGTSWKIAGYVGGGAPGGQD
jgi:hypothetical protein